jgi:putative ABC transport system substrate-binding protein
MRRRAFLSAIGVAIAAHLPPLATSWAQPPARLPRIGVLSPGSDMPNAMIAGLREGLKEAGYVEGRNVQVEYRWAEGRLERLPALAAELVALRPDVIVSVVTPASLAAQAATTEVPIVMVGVGDPIGVGLIGSLARPGGNITGTATQQADVVTKQVETIKQLDPSTSRIAVLWNPANTRFQSLQLEQAKHAASASGLALQVLPASRPEEIEAAFAAVRNEATRTLLILADPLFALHRHPLAERAARERLTTICGSRDFSEAGCLISYGPSYFEASRRAADYVRKILQGARPGDLPVEQPTKFDLIINMKAANALRLPIPPTLLARADEVIE